MMPTRAILDLSRFTVDKERLQWVLAQKNHEGHMPDAAQPTMTPKQLRTRMETMGVCPEDNIASCGIIAARDEE